LPNGFYTVEVQTLNGATQRMRFTKMD
jgi:hypothetical protein